MNKKEIEYYNKLWENEFEKYIKNGNYTGLYMNMCYMPTYKLIDLYEYTYEIKKDKYYIVREHVLNIINARYPYVYMEWLKKYHKTNIEECKKLRKFILTDTTEILEALDFYYEYETDEDILEMYNKIRKGLNNIQV